jgi:hypothetical protein
MIFSNRIIDGDFLDSALHYRLLSGEEGWALVGEAAKHDRRTEEGWSVADHRVAPNTSHVVSRTCNMRK